MAKIRHKPIVLTKKCKMIPGQSEFDLWKRYASKKPNINVGIRATGCKWAIAKIADVNKADFFQPNRWRKPANKNPRKNISSTKGAKTIPTKINQMGLSRLPKRL